MWEIYTRMAEWSKAPDSSSGGRKSAWVRTPLHALLVIAQLVEQWTVNPCVAGSSPANEIGSMVKRLSLQTLNLPSRVQIPVEPFVYATYLDSL